MPLNTNYLIFKNFKPSSNNIIFIFYVSISIYSCVSHSSSEKISVSGKSISLNMSLDSDSLIYQIYAPYKKSIDSIMDIVLCYSPEFLEKSKPESALSNWIADVCMISVPKNNVDFCLLNYGGIRSSLPKGEITTKNIYELMPFENELVIVEIPILNFEEALNYLSESNGHPISGIKLNFNGKKISHSLKLDSSVRILTSDYLANGGDKMYFFSDSISYKKTNLKIRNILLNYCEHIDTIQTHKDQRYSYE